jgi:alginate O-acetyltransferase complex protein AlgI
MLFNSIEFGLFFPIVTILYFLIPHKFRWFHLLVASCIFYMAFVPVYILILFFTIIIDYYAGILIENSVWKHKKLFLIFSLIANIGILAVFKYYNFFIENMNTVLHSLNISTNTLPYLTILLPIGLSFHTFQAMSYTIEVYRGNQKAERHFGIYALYVMFYPQLVAGPIERPQNLLHQFHEVHFFDTLRFKSGIKLMLWGFFKKIVIADRLGIYVNQVYGNVHDYKGIPLLIAAIFFVFQIYCDFSAYSDIALGSARIMGFDLMKNFNFPYISKNVTEFWRRWHISLSTWFFDYLYFPIVVNKRDWGINGVVFGLFITFFLSGLWHGAGWTFVIYGCLHGLALIYEVLTKKVRKKIAKKMPDNMYTLFSVFLTISFVGFTWIFFRAKDIQEAVYIVSNILSDIPQQISRILSNNNYDRLDLIYLFYDKWIFFLCIGGILLLETVQYIQRKFSIVKLLSNKPAFLRWSFYYLIVATILYYGVFEESKFIYFQF